jgi:HK97 family phage prohead protease
VTERRSYAVPSFDLEERGEGFAPVLRGHAAVFNSLSEDLGGFREQIAPGAFASAIVEDDVRALFNHDPNYVLGRSKAGTLRMREDEQGLQVEIDPPNTAVARHILESIRRGDVSQMSFGFVVRQDSWQRTADGSHLRTLHSVRLFDVSPVTYPAYAATDVAVRSLAAWQAEQPSEIRQRTPRLSAMTKRQVLVETQVGMTGRSTCK